MSLLEIGLLLVAGVIAGFINALAGGGSLITIPALLFIGLPSTIANATNRVAVTMQSAAGALRFQQKGVFSIKESAAMSIPALAGAAVGAVIAAEINQEVFDIVLAFLLIFIVVTLFVKPKAADTTQERHVSPWIEIPVFFLIGVYGGFIQAGVGFLLIGALTLIFGYDLVKTNGIKLLIVTLFTGLALAIFAIYGQVMWIYGLVLGVGNIVGVLIGVRFAIKRGAAAIRWVVVAAVAVTVLDLLGIISW